MSNEQLLVRCARPRVLIFYVRMRSNTTSYYYSTSRQFLSLFFFFWMTLLLFLAMNALLMTTSALMRVPFHTPYPFLLLLSPFVDPIILFRVDNVVIRLGFFFFFRGEGGFYLIPAIATTRPWADYADSATALKIKCAVVLRFSFLYHFLFCFRDVELNLLNQTYYIQKRRTVHITRIGLQRCSRAGAACIYEPTRWSHPFPQRLFSGPLAHDFVKSLEKFGFRLSLTEFPARSREPSMQQFFSPSKRERSVQKSERKSWNITSYYRERRWLSYPLDYTFV